MNLFTNKQFLVIMLLLVLVSTLNARYQWLCLLILYISSDRKKPLYSHCENYSLSLNNLFYISFAFLSVT
nr:hypothetical protein [Mucilaginibacter sp. E4BP6]